MSASDYCAISRKLIHSEMWLAEPFTRGQAWVDMIACARWKAGFVRIRGVRIDLKRGQFALSVSKYAERWRWSQGKVRRFLNELQTDAQVVVQKNNVTSVVTITNYNAYQPDGRANGRAIGEETVGQTEGQTVGQTETIEERQEIQERQEPPPPEADKPAAAPPDEAWDAMVVEVSSAGVTASEDTVRRARSAGYSPGQVRDVVDHFAAERTKQGWEAGALRFRLTQTPASAPIDQGWPPPSEKARSDATKVADLERKKSRERMVAATAIIKAGRRAGADEKAIRAKLAAKGLAWPGEDAP